MVSETLSVVLNVPRTPDETSLKWVDTAKVHVRPADKSTIIRLPAGRYQKLIERTVDSQPFLSAQLLLRSVTETGRVAEQALLSLFLLR